MLDDMTMGMIKKYGYSPEYVEAQFQASVDNARLLTERDVLREVCEEIASGSEEAQEIMRREGFVIDNLEDRWQKLAFTFYTMLANHSAKAIAALDANKDEQRI